MDGAMGGCSEVGGRQKILNGSLAQGRKGFSPASYGNQSLQRAVDLLQRLQLRVEMVIIPLYNFW